MRAGAVAAAWVAAMLLVASPARGALDSIPGNAYVTDGAVQAMAVAGGTLYLGGSFTEIGPRTGPLAAVAAADGKPDLSRLTVSGDGAFIRAIAPDGHGGSF